MQAKIKRQWFRIRKKNLENELAANDSSKMKFQKTNDDDNKGIIAIERENQPRISGDKLRICEKYKERFMEL